MEPLNFREICCADIRTRIQTNKIRKNIRWRLWRAIKTIAQGTRILERRETPRGEPDIWCHFYPQVNYGLKCDSWEAEQAMAAKWLRSWTQLLAFSWGYGGQFGFTSWQIEKVLVNTPDFPVKLLTKSKVELEIGNLNKSWFLGWEDSLEEGMATHSSILAWRILMDRGAWWATVHGVAKIQIQLSD